MEVREPERDPGQLQVHGVTGCALGLDGEAGYSAEPERLPRGAAGMMLVSLVAGSWVALALIGASPYAALVSHDGQLIFFLAGWLLMSVAMMLPSSLPFVTLFGTITRQASDRAVLLALLVAGYLLTWVGFGLVAFAGDVLVHEGVERGILSAQWVWPATLGVAGLYQFLPLKHSCLRQCRSPVGFLIQHWHGGARRRAAIVLGVRHGLFCVGCCWALMLVMFAVGGVNVGWMLAFGALMFYEKAMPGGQRLSTPLGVALLIAAVAAFR